MAGPKVRLDVDEREIEQLVRSVDVRELLLDSAEPIVGRARLGAPEASGEGAASIRREAVLDGPDWTVRISWDRDHFYMYFHDRGTVRLPARPFLEPALEAAL